MRWLVVVAGLVVALSSPSRAMAQDEAPALEAAHVVWTRPARVAAETRATQALLRSLSPGGRSAYGGPPAGVVSTPNAPGNTNLTRYGPGSSQPPPAAACIPLSAGPFGPVIGVICAP